MDKTSCPFCAEDISGDAEKCPSCGERLHGEPAEVSSGSSGLVIGIILGLTALVVLVVIGASFFFYLALAPAPVPLAPAPVPVPLAPAAPPGPPISSVIPELAPLRAPSTRCRGRGREIE